MVEPEPAPHDTAPTDVGSTERPDVPACHRTRNQADAAVDCHHRRHHLLHPRHPDDRVGPSQVDAIHPAGANCWAAANYWADANCWADAHSAAVETADGNSAAASRAAGATLAVGACGSIGCPNRAGYRTTVGPGSKFPSRY